MSDLLLSPEDNERFQKTIQLYSIAKKLIIFSEEIDPNSKINPQIWKELRDALDHFMRVFYDVFINNKKKLGQNKNYYFENLDKAHGHVYRAAFDALDGASISLRRKITELADDNCRECLQAVIPGYWKIRTEQEAINNRITELRLKKDVATDELVENINEYIVILDQLKIIHSTFLNSMPLLKEWDDRNKQEEAKRQRNNFKNRIIMFLAGGIITAILFVPLQELIKGKIHQSTDYKTKEQAIKK